jgi:lipid A 3-O-deacylase
MTGNSLSAWAIGAVVGAIAFAGGSASAGPLEQVSVGLLAHNIEVIDPKNAGKEDGPAMDLQFTFESPSFLRVLGGPRPYVAVTPNLAGETSFAAVGLQWHIPFAEHWSIDPGFGYAVHDGEVTNAFPNGDPRATAFNNAHVLLGSRDLFRSHIGITRQLTDRVGAQLFYSHYSHGQILGNGRNQGMDQAGLRLTFSLED